MAKMTTKELFDEYFKTMPSERARKVRAQVDRPEVYAYEIKIGKQLIDMNVDELIGLLLSLNAEREFGKNNFTVAYGTIDQFASICRAMWNYYIDNIEVIRNPWNDKRMRGTTLAKRLAEDRKPFTFETINNAISKVYDAYPEGNYNPPYIESLVLLFYNGFSSAQEIVLLKENMINFRTHEVRMPGRIVHLSSRCYEMLEYVHNLDEIDTQRGTFKAVSYHDGYFKFIVRQKEATSFQERSLADVGATLTRKITMCIRKEFNIDINYRMIYLLGFYNYIAGKAGNERAKELIVSVRNSADSHELMRYASEYGVMCDNVTILKKNLRMFIK